MKKHAKALLAFLLVIVFMLSSFSCGKTSEPVTYHTEKQSYTLGEKVKIYDDQSYGYLGEITITNVRVLSDVPYFKREYYCRADNLTQEAKVKYGDKLEIEADSVYLLTEYQSIVQIDYSAKTIDSSYKITSKNLTIKDAKHNKADNNVTVYYDKYPTQDESIVVGLLEKGDINIDFTFKSSSKTLCEIYCKYNSETETYNVTEDKETTAHFCPACNKSIDKTDKYCRHCGQKQ